MLGNMVHNCGLQTRGTWYCPEERSLAAFNFSQFFFSIRYHGSSSSIKCHVYHHVGGRRHTPVVCNEKREPHTSHYTSRPVTKKKQPTNYSNQPLCSRPVKFFLFTVWRKRRTYIYKFQQAKKARIPQGQRRKRIEHVYCFCRRTAKAFVGPARLVRAGTQSCLPRTQTSPSCNKNILNASLFSPLSDIMDLRHQSSAMCSIMLGGEDTPVVCNESRGPHTSHYTSNKKKQPKDYSNQPLSSRGDQEQYLKE